MSNASLLIFLFIAHYIGDYSHLSTNWMLSAKRIGKPYLPIAAHALAHACLMTFICNIYTALPMMNYKYDNCDSVFLIQLSTHFAIDVLKGKCNVWFPSFANPANKAHWYVFGFDQLLHQIVIIGIWYFVTNK